MDGSFETVNPLIWLHFRLIGGWRRIGWTFVVVVAVFFIAVSIGRRLMADVPLNTFAMRILMILGMVQAIIILVTGANAVHRAVRRDQSTRMMESHRLSPITEVQAIIGYAIGPNLQTLGVFAIGTILGVGLSYVANLPVGQWLMAMCYLVIAAAMLWSLAMLHGLTTSRGGNPVWGVIMAGVFGYQFIIPMFPGIVLALGINVVLFAYRQAMGGGSTTVPAHLLVAFIAEAIVTALWLFGAARKFRRPERPSYESVWGYVLLGVMLALFGVGYALRDYFGIPAQAFGMEKDLADFGSFLVTMLIAAVPIYGAEFVRWHGRLDDRPPAWWQRPLAAAAIATVMVIAAWLIAFAAHYDPETHRTTWLNPLEGPALRRWLITTWIVAVWLLSVVGIVRLCFALKTRAKVRPVVLWGVLISVGAPVAEQIRRAVAGFNSHAPPEWSMLFAFSPAGALYATWHDMNIPVWPGLSALTVGAMVLVLIASRLYRGKVRRVRAAASATPA